MILKIIYLTFHTLLPLVTIILDETYANSEQKCHSDKNRVSDIEKKHTRPHYSFFEGPTYNLILRVSITTSRLTLTHPRN